MSGFNDAVLAWLRSAVNADAQTVVSVDGIGNDMAGDTDAGWHSEFNVSIVYTTSVGSHYEYVSGEDMGSLWRWVTKEWPDTPT